MTAKKNGNDSEESKGMIGKEFGNDEKRVLKE